MEATTKPEYRVGDLVKARYQTGISKITRKAQVLVVADLVRGIGSSRVYLIRWMDWPRTFAWLDEREVLMRFGHMRVFDLDGVYDVE